MATKLSYKENEKKTVFSYNMKSFNCEICKTPYPLRFKFDNKLYDMIDSARPQKNYIVLESLNQMKDGNNYKSIHVVTLNEDERIILVYEINLGKRP
jgi:plasmid maintenance system killer protein